MNNIKTARTNYIKNLNNGDRFLLPGNQTVYVCEYRKTEGNRTNVTYRTEGTDRRNEFTRVNLSTVYIIED